MPCALPYPRTKFLNITTLTIGGPFLCHSSKRWTPHIFVSTLTSKTSPLSLSHCPWSSQGALQTSPELRLWGFLRVQVSWADLTIRLQLEMTYSRSALRQEVLVGLGIKRGLYQYLVHKEVEMDTSHFVSFPPLLPGDGVWFFVAINYSLLLADLAQLNFRKKLLSNHSASRVYEPSKRVKTSLWDLASSTNRFPWLLVWEIIVLLLIRLHFIIN